MDNKDLLESIRIMLKEELKKELDPIKMEQESMKKSLKSMERRQDEIFDVVKSIEHSNNTRKAEIDNLTHKVAHIEGTMSAVGELIQKRA